MPPANSVIDLEEEQADSFASGVNFYKVALICIAGSVAGVVVEILWCLFRNGYIRCTACSYKNKTYCLNKQISLNNYSLCDYIIF